MDSSDNPIKIPSSTEVRQAIVKNQQEANLLRRLLKVAEEADRQAEERDEWPRVLQSERAGP